MKQKKKKKEKKETCNDGMNLREQEGIEGVQNLC
jgi:hypothetical protein